MKDFTVKIYQFFSFILQVKGHDKNADQWLDGRDMQCNGLGGGCESSILSSHATIRTATFSLNTSK